LTLYLKTKILIPEISNSTIMTRNMSGRKVGFYYISDSEDESENDEFRDWEAVTTGSSSPFVSGSP